MLRKETHYIKNEISRRSNTELLGIAAFSRQVKYVAGFDIFPGSFSPRLFCFLAGGPIYHQHIAWLGGGFRVAAGIIFLFAEARHKFPWKKCRARTALPPTFIAVKYGRGLFLFSYFFGKSRLRI